MKKMMKLSTGLLLGALLCLGILVTPQTAEAYYWTCSDGVTIWCADVAFSGGARYCNTGAWCNYPSLGQYICWYSRC